MAREYPLVAVGGADAGERALVAVVFHPLGDVVAGEEESGDGEVDARGVKLAPHGVHAEEMTVEFGAGPPSVFGHEHPVLGFPVAFRGGVESPRVEAVDQVDGRLFPDAHLYSDVGSSGGIVEEVGLHGCLLGRGTPGDEGGCKYRQP